MHIFLYGSDTFRSSEKLISLKNKYLEKNSSGTDLSVLEYGENSQIENLHAIFSSQGLFSAKRLVIVKNCMLSGTSEQQKRMLAFLKANPELEKDNDVITIFLENGNPKKNGAMFKYLSEHSKKQEFAPLSGAQLSNWTLKYTKNLSEKVSFSRNALNLLLASTGNDLHFLSNELRKLVAYKNHHGIIREEDVDLLTKVKIDSTIFQTIEALFSGNKSLALKLLHEQISKGEDAFYILSMYLYQIRTLLKIGDFYWRGMTIPQQIASTSKIHPYVVQKSLMQIRNLSEEKAKQIFKTLAQIDQDAKTGKADIVLALDSFIVSL
ncbi:MAG TPA: DNA polymerase III subunit delta [Candidatus Moranbacteria bacterium]|jgi:DNA polymerase-3 subunit delta|nr:DNA polymerase III subunit delta [Candidatus Moranbacteria bacterium]HOF42775.1 DNA polymerase III subunit delta [Candidatus Moranbacteria bacterium]HPX94609.1 DNA polymerase III subunit delta [Candidatus Moranbacteria bacterium]HQB59812.1 DNA polymerase III subunit delta [Candidatus Moranbacteria bacterium]